MVLYFVDIVNKYILMSQPIQQTKFDINSQQLTIQLLKLMQLLGFQKTYNKLSEEFQLRGKSQPVQQLQDDIKTNPQLHVMKTIKNSLETEPQFFDSQDSFLQQMQFYENIYKSKQGLNHNNNQQSNQKINQEIFLETLFKMKEHVTKQYRLPNFTVYDVVMPKSISIVSISPNSQLIAIVDQNSNIAIIKNKTIVSKQQKKNKKSNVKCLDWLTQSIFVVGDDHGKIHILRSTLQQDKQFTLFSRPIDKILIFPDKKIVAISGQAVKIVKIDQSLQYITDLGIVPVHQLVKSPQKQLILGINKQKNKIIIVDVKVKQLGYIEPLSGKFTKLKHLQICKKKQGFLLLASFQNKNYLLHLSLSGYLLQKKLIPCSSHSIKKLYPHKFTIYKEEDGLIIVQFRDSHKIGFFSLQTEKYLSFIETEYQKISNCLMLLNNEVLITHGKSFKIYSTKNKPFQTKKVFPKAETELRRIALQRSQMLAFIRSIQMGPDLGFNINFGFAGQADDDNQDQQQDENEQQQQDPYNDDS